LNLQHSLAAGIAHHYVFPVAVFDYFGETIRAIRELRELSQEELGDRIERSGQQVGKWEANLARPDLDEWGLLLERTQVSLVDFVELMLKLTEIAERPRATEVQFELFRPAESEVREAATVERVFFTTDRGELVQLEDPQAVRVLTELVAYPQARRRTILSLTTHRRRPRREPRRRRRGPRPR
jgi:transcriptional regulator with XRE-family HTH domain